MKREDARASQEVRRVASRAIRRLNVLEWVILAAAAALALGAGALTALLLAASLELPFRGTWLVASLLLFAIPAFGALVKERRMARGEAARGESVGTDDQGRDRHGR